MKQRYRQPFQLVPFEVMSCAVAAGKTLEVSGFRQVRSYTCGYAATALVLDFFGEYVPAAQLFRRLGTGRDGTRQNAIVREIRAQGIAASVRYDVGFERICNEIDRDKLVVSYLADAEHWVVLYGYSRQPDRVYVADSRPEESCEHPWKLYGPRLNQFGIVCSGGGARMAKTGDIRGLAPTIVEGEPKQLSFPF